MVPNLTFNIGMFTIGCLHIGVICWYNIFILGDSGSKPLDNVAPERVNTSIIVLVIFHFGSITEVCATYYKTKQIFFLFAEIQGKLAARHALLRLEHLNDRNAYVVGYESERVEVTLKD